MSTDTPEQIFRAIKIETDLAAEAHEDGRDVDAIEHLCVVISMCQLAEEAIHDCRPTSK